jgi:4-amino-4-deoxy-L-arabinose transferase
MNGAPARGAVRRGDAVAVATLVCGTCLLLLPGLGRMAARDSTDARYLEVAREMHASGDWLVPHLAGVRHLEKPPLAYWAAAAGFAAFGVTPLAGRLAQQLSLAATAALLFGWARSRMGPQAALASAALFLTSGLVFASSRGLHTDLFQLFFLTGALLALFEGSAGRSGPTALAGALLGASMLAKGPVALLLALSILVPFLALRRRERRLPVRGVLAGATLFAAIGLPWYAFLVWNDPSLPRWFFEHQVLGRVQTGLEGHLHGALYLPAHVLLGLLPWTPVALLGLWRLRPRRGRRSEDLDLFLLLWALVPCVLFQIFPTKLATYLLPAFPAVALAVGRTGARGLLRDPAARGTIAASIALAGLAALALAGLLVAAGAADRAPRWLEYPELRAPAAFAVALALLGGAVIALAAQPLRHASSASLPRAALAAGAVFALGSAALAPGLSDHEADAQLVRSVPGARVIEYGVFEPGLLFYTAEPQRHFVAVYARLAALARHAPEAAHLGLRHQDVAAMVGEDVPTFVLAKSSQQETLERELGLRPLRRTRHFVLMANAAAATRVPEPLGVAAGR